MYKVLVVDDERFIRKSIINRIDWSKYGFFVEAEAGDGEEALRILEKIRPELILVDIRMPIMDGLTFITEAKKRLPKSRYVIMSAFSDFAYAKKAIQLGVEDYVLKPLEEEEMEKILEKTMYSLNRISLTKQVIRTEYTEQSPLKGRIAAIAFWNETDEEYGEKIDQRVRMAPYIQENHIDVYSIEGFSRENCFLFILNGGVLTEEGIYDLLDSLVTGEDADVRVSFSSVQPISKVREAAVEAIWALKRKLFYSGKRVLRSDSSRNYQEGDDTYKEIRERIFSAQRSFIKKEYEKSIQEFVGIVDKVILPENTVAIIEEMIHESLMLLRYFAENQSTRTDFNIMFHRFQSRDYLLLYHSAEELRNGLKEVFARAMDNYGNMEGRDTVEAIKDYIKENYSESLNATDIAGQFYLNPSYMSTMFREKTGMKLTNYIEGIRMEKAKEYLKNHTWNVTEIAFETGYSDPNYFSKVFKRYTGVSPKQFKELETSATEDI